MAGNQYEFRRPWYVDATKKSMSGLGWGFDTKGISDAIRKTTASSQSTDPMQQQATADPNASNWIEEIKPDENYFTPGPEEPKESFFTKNIYWFLGGAIAILAVWKFKQGKK